MYSHPIYIRDVGSDYILFFVYAHPPKHHILKGWVTGYEEFVVHKSSLRAPGQREYFDLILAAYNKDSPASTELALHLLSDFSKKDTRYD